MAGKSNPVNRIFSNGSVPFEAPSHLKLKGVAVKEAVKVDRSGQRVLEGE